MSQQLFKHGDHVKVADDLGPAMRHFPKGVEAVVIGSYADQYGGRERDSHTYTLHLKGHGQTSWYHEQQLTLIEKNRIDLLKQWEDEAIAKEKQESDLDWIFSPEHAHEKFQLPGASAQAISDLVGGGSLWGTRGEGFEWQRNYLIICSFALPFIVRGDKAGFMIAVEEAKARISEAKAAVQKPEPCTPPYHPPPPDPEPVPADKEK